MTLTITGRVIRSPYTRHTATAQPVPGQPAQWTVTWLPGRTLTRDQAVAAMALADALGAIPADCDPEVYDEKFWEHADSLADALGLTGPDAAVRVTDPEPAAGS